MKPLAEFLVAHSDADIFCLQEIFNGSDEENIELFTNLTNFGDIEIHLLERIKKLLPNHTARFCPSFENSFGTAIFVKNGLEVTESGEVLLYRNASFPNLKESDEDIARKMQWLKLKVGRTELTVMNVHGHWASDKLDNDARIEQSKKILEFVGRTHGPKVLSGDFNLSLDTESVRMLDEKMENLVRKHNVESTRTRLYTKSGKHADYIFTSPEISVESFEVLPDEVSDHAPLLLSFQVR